MLLLKYTLFYILFTAFTLAAVCLYCDKQAGETEILAMRVDEIRNENMKILVVGTDRNKQKLTEIVRFFFIRTDTAAIIKIKNTINRLTYKYEVYEDSLNALNKRKFEIKTDEPDFYYTKKRLYKNDIQAYLAWHNEGFVVDQASTMI